MLQHFRRLARSLYERPVIGPLARWAVVLLRLPTLQRRQVEGEQRQLELVQRQSELVQRQSELAQRQTELAMQQTAAEETASRANSALQIRLDEASTQLAERLATVEAMLERIDVCAQENLVISVPVALRRSARDIAQLRAQIGPPQHTVVDGSERNPA